MAQRNTMRLDTSGFEVLLKRLDDLGGNVKGAVSDALQQVAETIKEDTIEAVDASNLPAHGRYSSGATKESIIRDTRVRWEGDVGWVPVGFDFSKPGAGGYLITGTPRMRPDAALNKMYKQKKYMQWLQKGIEDVIMDYITDKMED